MVMPQTAGTTSYTSLMAENDSRQKYGECSSKNATEGCSSRTGRRAGCRVNAMPAALVAAGTGGRPVAARQAVGVCTPIGSLGPCSNSSCLPLRTSAPHRSCLTPRAARSPPSAPLQVQPLSSAFAPQDPNPVPRSRYQAVNQTATHATPAHPSRRQAEISPPRPGSWRRALSSAPPQWRRGSTTTCRTSSCASTCGSALLRRSTWR